MTSSDGAPEVGKEILGCFLSLDLNESTSLIRPFLDGAISQLRREGYGRHLVVVVAVKAVDASP